MRQIIEAAVTFHNLGDVVTIAQPTDAQEVALRLYDHGLTLAIISIIPVPDAQPTTAPRRFLLTDNPVLPDNFVKYIGALLFAVSRDVLGVPKLVQAYVLEIS
jgi:hypothetical protein